MRRITKTSLIIISSIVALLLLITIVATIVLSDRFLAGLTKKYAVEYIDADVNIEKVSLDLWTKFPNPSLSLVNGAVVGASKDTLLSFGELSATVSLHNLLFSELVIRRFSCSDLNINGEIDNEGKANWDILKLPPSDSSAESNFSFKIRRVNFKGKNNISYVDKKEGVNLNVKFDTLTFRGDVSDDIKDLDIKKFEFKNIVSNLRVDKENVTVNNIIDNIGITSDKGVYNLNIISKNSVSQKGEYICRNLPFKIYGGVDFRNIEANEIGFNDFIIDFAGIKPHIDGKMIVGGGKISSDLVCRIDSLTVAEIIELTPEHIAPQIKKLSSDISFELIAKAEGVYDDSLKLFPDMSLDIKSSHGFISSSDTKISLDDLKCDIGVNYDSKNYLWCDVRDFILKGAGIYIDMKGAIRNIFTDPQIDGKITANVDIERFTTLFMPEREIDASGDVEFNCVGKISTGQMNLQKIGQSSFDSNIKFSDVRFNDRQSKTNLYMNGNINVLATSKDTVLLNEKRVVSVASNIDSLFFNSKDSMIFTISKLSFGMRSASSLLSWDTTRVNPFVGNVKLGFVKIDGVDSTMIYSSGINCNYSVSASDKNPKLPIVKLYADSKILYFRDLVNRYAGKNSSVDINILINKSPNSVTDERRSARLDSLQQIYPDITRDSLVAHNRKIRGLIALKDDFEGADFDFSIDKRMSDFINRLAVNGRMSSDSLRVITPYMPLVNRLVNVDMSFTQDEVNIHKSDLICGESRADFKCSISNISRVIAGRGKLKLKADISSDKLNIDELSHAAIVGLLYVEMGQSFKDSLSATDNESMQQLLTENNNSVDTSNVLIVVPSNIDADIKFNLLNSTYKELVIDSLDAEVVIRNRCAQIKEMCAVTNMGHFDLSAIYSTKSKADLITGFDLAITRMNISRLIKLMPQVDSLLPMMRSFEGIVDCRIAATAAIDASMNIILPSLNAACRIKGDSVVLLDGETFGEIAKTLKFKNKKRNVIDKISVELLIENNVMEVFPFIMEMDRYKTAISGYHNLDLTYYYHISVLHSPIPFRLGIDVRGDAEDFKYRITKAKYKNENIPSYVELIDTTQMNLRKNIINIFRRNRSEVSLSDFAINTKTPDKSIHNESESLSQADSVALKTEGIIGVE